MPETSRFIDVATSGVRVCGARGDTRVGDEARYPTAFGGSFAIGYCLSPLWVGCRALPIHHSQLNSKANLQPSEGHDPDYVAFNETLIRVNDPRYWLFAAVEPVLESPAARTIVPDQDLYADRDVPRETPRETSCRLRDLSGQ